MHSHDTESQALAIATAAMAGYVDGLGFLSLGGNFVSFMSGNSTRFSVALVSQGSWGWALTPLGIIALFVIGVMVGRLIRHACASRPSTSVLVFMALVLALAALLAEVGFVLATGPLMAVAMGAANNVFVREGEVSIGVTYMTGALVKCGQRLAGRLLGERDSDWRAYFLLWLGLVVGAALGAAAYGFWELRATWLAAAVCAVMAGLVWRSERLAPA